MSEERQFRKKPVVIEAVQFTGSRESVDEVGLFMGVTIGPYARLDGAWAFSIPTLEGPLNASPGDWIIRGVKGEFYPCKPDIFAATYEPASRSEESGTAAKHFDSVWDFAQRAYVLLDNLSDDDECQLDHHGNCQAHNLERECSHPRARALLDQYSDRFDEIQAALAVSPSSGKAPAAETR